MRLAAIALSVAVVGAGCATAGAPPLPVATPAATPGPVVIPIERKAGWILRLEQQRVLKDASVGADLAALASDADAGVRRRALLAIGRVGDADGVAPLVAALKDPDEAVRAAAAFALGLLADARAVAPLQNALADPSPVVRGRAAEGLGLVGAPEAAPAVAAAAAPCPALIATVSPDEEGDALGAEIDGCRLSILALVRLRNYDALAKVILGDGGRPVSTWWPVAYALQRIGDRRAADPLVSLLAVKSVYTPAFALRGLAALKDPRALAPALAFARRPDEDARVRAEAIRVLGQVGAADAVTALLAMVSDRATPRNLMIEAITSLGSIGHPKAFDAMLDLFASPAAPVRIAAMQAAARIDAEGFLLALSSAERDRDWTVRASQAGVLATLPPERVRAALEDLAADADTRVQGPAVRALVQIGAPDADRRVFEALEAPDFALRAEAAALAGERRFVGGVPRLAAAYVRGDSDATPSARLAAIDALARYDEPAVTETLTKALADREWSVRVRAAALLRQRGQPAAAPVRPAPLRQDPAFFESDRLLRPAFSPQAYVDTPAGLVQIELDVVDAPLTSLAFVELARAGFFNGVKVHRLIPNFVVQAGDPRGDGRGGPGYTIRDEFGTRPFVRGAVGMALGGAETGGSQFFIALSPQPHLDARYTVFGRVVAGLDVLDRITLGDAILRVTIQDGR